MKGCSKWVWKYPGWILNVFIHFYEGLDGLWAFRSSMSIFLTVLSILGGYFGTKMGPFLGSIRVIWGSFWCRFGIIVASFWGRFWCRFDAILRLLWTILARFLVVFWEVWEGSLDHLAPPPPLFLGGILRSVCGFWRGFGRLNAKLIKMVQEKAKMCEFLQNFYQNYATLSKN